MTVAEIKQYAKAAESSGSAMLRGGYEISTYRQLILATGKHRAWKYIYYLHIAGEKLGGYDRLDSFAMWAKRKIDAYEV